MTKPMTPSALLIRLQELMVKLDKINEDMIEADREHTDAKIVYDFMSSKASDDLASELETARKKLTVPAIDAKVHLAVENEYNDLMHAAERLRSVRIRAEQIKLEIEVHRSMSSLIKAELSLTGMID